MVSYLELWFQAWLPVAGLALGLATILVGLVYMFGSALMNDRMKGWAKLEAFEILYSAIIIALAISGLGLVDSVVQGALLGPGGTTTEIWVHEWDSKEVLCPAPGATDKLGTHPDSMYYKIPACHIRLGMWYLHSVFKETSDIAYKTYLVYTYTSMLADLSINFEFITEAAGFFTFTPWRGFFTMGNTIKAMTFDYAIKIMMAAKFQEIMLAFIARAAFPGIFVIGVILRTFTFSRKLGGLLMALAIALYYIFPAFYAFGGLVMMDIKEQAKQDTNFKAICKDLGKHACEDPPIANALYLNGSIPMPGGAVKVDDALEYQNTYESMTSRQRAEAMEKTDSDMKPLKGVDFSKSLTSAQRTAAMENAKNKTDTWMGEMTKRSKFDYGISVAYAEGGPIDALGRLAFFSLFFSLFGILGTIAAVRSISVTFGGDIEIAGLTHLI